MKKILTLIIGFGLTATAFAQTSREEAKRVILGKGNNGNTTEGNPSPKDVIIGGRNRNQRSYPNYPNYPTTGTSRDQQIAQVNYEYDQKIQSVRNNGYLSAAEKDRAIRQLEADRARRIREINKAYDGGSGDRDRDRDRDHDRDYKGKGKGNNGNHYGWEKGKGNPHKNGGKNKDKKWEDD